MVAGLIEVHSKHQVIFHMIFLAYLKFCKVLFGQSAESTKLSICALLYEFAEL